MSERTLITLKWSVVQQPMFPTLWDNLIWSDHGMWKVDQLAEALGIRLTGRLGVEDVVKHLLSRRRYVYALVRDREFNGVSRLAVEQYFRREKDDAGS